MIYLLKMAENQKKPVEQERSSESNASLNNVESLTERRRNTSKIKARQKVLLASSKLNW